MGKRTFIKAGPYPSLELNVHPFGKHMALCTKCLRTLAGSLECQRGLEEHLGHHFREAGSPGAVFRLDEAKLAKKKHRFLRTFGGIWVDLVWNLELSDVEVHFRGPHMRGASVRIFIRNIQKGLGEQIGWHAFCRLHFSSSSRCTAMSQTCIQLSNSLAEHGLKLR